MVQHGAGKPTPWHVRGTPLGHGSAAGPSQVPNSEDINAAMAAAGDLAAFFPSTQAEPEVDGSVAANKTIGTTAAAAPNSNSTAAAAETSDPAASRTDQDSPQAVPDHAALPQQPSAFADAEHVHDAKATSQSEHVSPQAEQQAEAADGMSADKASQPQADEAKDDRTCRGAAPRQTSRMKQSGRAAGDEEEQEVRGSAVGRGRGSGSRGKGRGLGRGRGRKRSIPDTATVEDTIRDEQPQVHQSAAVCSSNMCTLHYTMSKCVI